MTTGFFGDVDKIRYEGPESSNPLAFRWYDANRVVLGKRLEDHLRFAVCYWHTFVWTGGDPFGGQTFDRPWFGDTLEHAKRKADVAFEMFTGKLPFQGRNAQEMMIARLRGQPVPVRQYRPDFPPKLEKVLMRSMETNPDNRYATTLEFGLAMAEALGSGVYQKLKETLQ